jgi:hypothetical protein
MILAVLSGLGVFVLWPRLQGALGLEDFGYWFLDSYSVLAASDTAKAGIDVSQPMQLDVLHRAHIYSDWWFVLGRVGLTRKDNFWVGFTWVASFLAVAFLCLQPRSLRQGAWYSLLTLSPPVLMGIFRANADLVIFTLLAAVALALRRPNTWRPILAIAGIALATGLKFYPVVAGIALFLVRPRQRMLASWVLALLVLGGVLIDVGPAVKRASMELPMTLHVFGAPALFHALGLSDGHRAAQIAGAVLIFGAGTWLARCNITRGKWVGETDSDAWERAAFVVGASVLVGCFVAGASYSYRCVVALLIAPWLWRHAATETAARAALWLCTATMWLDGIFCLVVNTLWSGLTQESIDRAARYWQIATQPLVWVLMALLAGWLLQMYMAALREPPCVEHGFD